MNFSAFTAALGGSGVWPFWAGGLAVGLFVVAFLLLGGHLLGISTGYADVCSLGTDPKVRKSWRIPFLVGVIAGGAISALSAGGITLTTAMGSFDTIFSASLLVKALVFTGGGILIGFGARLAGGCTSGHAIVGMAQLAPSSMIATGGFMVAGFAVTNLLVRGFGG